MERVNVDLFEDEVECWREGGEAGGIEGKIEGGSFHRLYNHSCNIWSKLQTALSGLTVDHADFSAGDPYHECVAPPTLHCSTL